MNRQSNTCNEFACNRKSNDLSVAFVSVRSGSFPGVWASLDYEFDIGSRLAPLASTLHVGARLLL